MEVLVPDASVLLKWALRSDDEADQDRALALKTAWLAGRCDIVVPTLWAFEVANVLGLKQPQAAQALLRAMVDLGMREVAPASIASEAFRLMRDHKVSFYDASYHAVAIAESGVMLTGDEAYVRKALRAGSVRRLRDWQPPENAGRA